MLFRQPGSASRDRLVGIEDKAGAVEHQLVLAAQLVEIDQRQAGFVDARRRQLSRTSSLPASKGEPLGTARDLRARFGQADR